MPLTFMHTDPLWLPRPDDIHPPELEHRARFVFTESLIVAYPGMAAKTISEVDDKDLEPGECVLYPMVNHPWTQNSSSFLFDFQPGNGGEETSRMRQIRRTRIEDLLGAKLARFFEQALRNQPELKELGPPTFDVEAGPISRTGSTYAPNEHGVYVPVHSWGMPKQ